VISPKDTTMPKRTVAAALMALSVASVHHKPADAAPLVPRGSVAETRNMVESVGGCSDCYRQRVAGRQISDVSYRQRSKVQGWSRRASIYRPRPLAKPSALWDPGFRYGAASWSDQRAWTYYGRW